MNLNSLKHQTMWYDASLYAFVLEKQLTQEIFDKIQYFIDFLVHQEKLETMKQQICFFGVTSMIHQVEKIASNPLHRVLLGSLYNYKSEMIILLRFWASADLMYQYSVLLTCQCCERHTKTVSLRGTWKKRVHRAIFSQKDDMNMTTENLFISSDWMKPSGDLKTRCGCLCRHYRRLLVEAYGSFNRFRDELDE